MTEKEIAERIAAARAKRGPKPAPINNTDLVKDFRGVGGSIVHCQSRDRKGKSVTFAFVAKRNRVEVATAVTHTNDSFAKKMGTKTAIEHFKEGKTITLPMNNSGGPVRLFKALGRFC